MPEQPEKLPNPYSSVYPTCSQCMGLGKIIPQGKLEEITCSKCEGRGYIVDPFTASTAPKESGG